MAPKAKKKAKASLPKPKTHLTRLYDTFENRCHLKTRGVRDIFGRCFICENEKNRRRYFVCNCTKLIRVVPCAWCCAEIIKQQPMNRLMNYNEIPCSCNAWLLKTDTKKLVTGTKHAKQQVAKMESITLNEWVLKHNAHFCPTPGCNGVYEQAKRCPRIHQGKESWNKCVACEYTYCVKCCIFSNDKENPVCKCDAGNKEETGAEYTQCPWCLNKVYKYEGCNSVGCVCGKSFCYLCGTYECICK